MLAQTDVAVRVDQAGHDPATVEHRLGAGDRFGAEHAADDPPLDRLAIGQPAAADVQVSSSRKRSSVICSAALIASVLRSDAH